MGGEERAGLRMVKMTIAVHGLKLEIRK